MQNTKVFPVPDLDLINKSVDKKKHNRVSVALTGQQSKLLKNNCTTNISNMTENI